MKILFTAINNAHLKTVQYSAAALREYDPSIKIDILILDNYTNFILEDKLKDFPGSIFSIPRKYGYGKLWDNPRIVSDNFLTIQSSLQSVLIPHSYDVVVMVQYDRGQIEVMLLDRCRRVQIPTVLLQEGLILFENSEDEGDLMPKDLKKKNVISRAMSALSLLGPHHSLTSNIRAKNYFRKHPRAGFGFNGAEYIGSISPYYSKLLEQKGFPRDKIYPVGLPRFDAIDELFHQNSSIEWESFSERKEIRILFPQQWGLQFGPKMTNLIEQVRIATDLASRLYEHDPRLKLVFRLREGEFLQHYPQEILMNPLFEIEDGNKVDPYKSILQSSVLISKTSTMIIEAMKLCRFCIVYDEEKNDRYGYVKKGGCLSAYDINSLVDSVIFIATNSALRTKMKQLSKTFTAERAMMDGHASERTAKMIIDVTSRK